MYSLLSIHKPQILMLKPRLMNLYIHFDPQVYQDYKNRFSFHDIKLKFS